MARVEKREWEVTDVQPGRAEYNHALEVIAGTDYRDPPTRGTRLVNADYTEQVEREREYGRAEHEKTLIALSKAVEEKDQARAELKVADQQIIDLQDDRDEARADCREAVEALARAQRLAWDLAARLSPCHDIRSSLEDLHKLLHGSLDSLSSYTQDEKEEQDGTD